MQIHRDSRLLPSAENPCVCLVADVLFVYLCLRDAQMGNSARMLPLRDEKTKKWKKKNKNPFQLPQGSFSWLHFGEKGFSERLCKTFSCCS